MTTLRDEAINTLSEVVATGFFGERLGGMMSREQATALVDSLLGAGGDELRERIVELRAALASIAGGAPPDEARPADAAWRLRAAQKAAEQALTDDAAREAKAGG